jgi:hypothetical protein
MSQAIKLNRRTFASASDVILDAIPDREIDVFGYN